MNAALLLDHYARIADAPDAVTRLRRFVLDLAVRGKLVQQDADEESSTRPLIAAKVRDFAENAELRGWVEAPLGRLLDFQYGKGLHANERQENGAVPVFGSNGIVAYTNTALTQKPSIIVGRKGSAGALNLCHGPSWTIDVAYFVEAPTYFSIRYLLLALSALGLDQLGKGVKPGLSRSDAYALVMSVPPLAEQQRIVAKVEELMALCDQLEAARGEREAGRDKLTAATLARLNAPDLETFPADARFALDNLTPLTNRPDQIKQLRQTILNLAVRGRLSTDSSWSEKPIPLAHVASLQNGYAFKSEWFRASGIRLLRNANVGHGSINWQAEVRLPEPMAQEYDRFQLNEGDIVLSLDRPFIATGTKVARVRNADLPALLLQRVGRFVLGSALASDYLFVWITSPHFDAQIDPGRSNGVPHISSKQVEAAEIYLPPLAEQQRLVAKVAELLAICDGLETSLTQGDLSRSRLLESVLHKALEPA